MKKTVLLSQRLIENKEYPETREALDVRWGGFLDACGLLPVPVSIEASVHDYFEIVKPAGVLLTGGNDLSSLSDSPLNVGRDRLERELLDGAVKRRLPVIGVCRGAQMIAEHFGGRLEKKPGHAGGIHPVVFGEKDGVFFRHYGKESQVNSYHNYAVVHLGRELVQTGAHVDGSIEAMRHAVHPIYGMMWHPERSETRSKKDVDFFKEIFGT